MSSQYPHIYGYSTLLVKDLSTTFHKCSIRLMSSKFSGHTFIGKSSKYSSNQFLAMDGIVLYPEEITYSCQGIWSPWMCMQIGYQTMMGSGESLHLTPYNLNTLQYHYVNTTSLYGTLLRTGVCTHGVCTTPNPYHQPEIIVIPWPCHILPVL